MIGIIIPEKRNRFIIDFEDEDHPFMVNIISLMSERNTLLKEIEALKEVKKDVKKP